MRGRVVEVCYNTHAAIDAKHKLVVDKHPIYHIDRNALTAIAFKAKHDLNATDFAILADKNYHNARELENCQLLHIKTIVAQQD